MNGPENTSVDDYLGGLRGTTEKERLTAQLQSASERAANLNRQAVQASVDVGKEKTQFFEKVALGCGGTIALTVSFVGAHSGRLQPPWLLRAALVALVGAMISAMYRNWKFHFYVLGAWMRQDLAAKQERERCRRDLIVNFPMLSAEDGKPIRVQEWLAEFAKDDETCTARIAECTKQETSAFKYTRVSEYLTLGLAVCGMLLLTAIAWFDLL